MTGEGFVDRLARPRALVQPCILLLLAEAPAHGYELMQRLRDLGFALDGPGPVYHQLRAMTAAKLVISALSTPGGGPGRRVYELTPAGRKALGTSTRALEEIETLLAWYFDRYGASIGRQPIASGTRNGTKPNL